MTKIRYEHESSTFSYVLAAGLIAIQLAHASPAHAGNDHSDRHLLQQPYYSVGSDSTFNNSANTITGVYKFSPNGFEKSVGDFYARLLNSQEPLGAEYEKVLYDNLWDLYES